MYLYALYLLLKKQEAIKWCIVCSFKLDYILAIQLFDEKSSIHTMLKLSH